MSLPYDQNRYRATIIRHVDADTTWADVDLGFDAHIRLSFRWEGIDAPERGTEAGTAATAFVNGLLPPGARCTITTTKDRREKYGRYLATFWSEDGDNLNEWMVREGYAVAYDGGAR